MPAEPDSPMRKVAAAKGRQGGPVPAEMAAGYDDSLRLHLEAEPQ